MVEVLQALGFRTRLKVIPDLGAYFLQVNPPRGPRAGGVVRVGARTIRRRRASCCRCSLVRAPYSCLTRYCDPRVDRSLAAASDADAQNPTAAPALWQRAERAILARAPVVPMYNLQDATFVAKRVGNVQQHPQWGVLLDRLWVR